MISLINDAAEVPVLENLSLRQSTAISHAWHSWVSAFTPTITPKSRDPNTKARRASDSLGIVANTATTRFGKAERLHAVIISDQLCRSAHNRIDAHVRECEWIRRREHRQVRSRALSTHIAS